MTDTPILNIESVGCQYLDRGYISTYYIPSLTYKVHKWFKDREETVYIPILFNKEDKIKNIFVHYNNIYFQIVFSRYSRSHASQLYPISKLIDFEKLANKADKEFDWKSENIQIQFIIKYNGYNIHLIYYPWDGFNSYPTDGRFDIFNNLNNSNILNDIKRNSNQFPQINCYAVYYGKSQYGTNLSRNFDHLIDAMKFIDDLIKDQEKVDSLYTKKSYKLVEE